MAQPRGKQRVKPSDEKRAPTQSEAAGAEEGETLSAIPELMRRAIAMGLSGFFTTEEAVRKAFGDTVPKDWSDFLLDTSDRTRAEFLDRVSREVGRVLEGVDVAAVISQLLDGRRLQINAEFQLTEKGTAGKTDVVFKRADREDDE
jgi:hypothetical protein